MLDWLANPGAVSVRYQGHDGAEDTPPASLSMICDALPLSPPTAPHAWLDLTTLERPINHPSPPPEHPPATINESPTQPQAPVTYPARGSQNRSSPLAPNNPLSTPQVCRSARRSTGTNKTRFTTFLRNYFFIFTQTTLPFTRCCFPFSVIEFLFCFLFVASIR